VSKNNDPVTISCTPCIQATVLRFNVVWFSGPLRTSLHVNLTVFEILLFNSDVGQYSRPGKTFIWTNFGAFSQKNANNLII